MKFNPTLTLSVLTLAALALTGSPVLHAQSFAPPPGAGLPGDNLDQLKSHAFEQRADFVDQVRELALQSDALIADLPDSQSDHTRAKAIAEAKSARANLDDHLAKAGQAVAENWEQIRDETLAALSQFQSASRRAATI